MVSLSNNPEIIRYGMMAYEASGKISDPELYADALDAAEKAFFVLGQTAKVRELNDTMVAISLHYGLTHRLAWSYNNLGYLSILEGDSVNAGVLMKKSYDQFISLRDFNMAFTCYRLLFNAGYSQYIDTLSNLISGYIDEEKDDRVLLQFYIEMSRLSNLKGTRVKSERYLQRAAEATDKIKDDHSILFFYLELAKLYNIHENRKQEMFYVQRAVELAEETNNSTGLIGAYNQIAAYFVEVQRNYSLALLYYEKILNTKQEANSFNTGNEFIQIGEMHRLMGNDSLAIVNFNAGLQNGLARKHRHTISSALLKLGDLNFQNRNYQEALRFYSNCLETGCDFCPPVKFHDALIKSGYAWYYSNNTDSARLYFRRSIDLANSASDNYAKINSFQAEGFLFEKTGGIDDAINSYLKAYILAREIDNLEGQSSAAVMLGNLYAGQNRYQEAYNYLSISEDITDSIRELNQVRNQAKFENWFEFQTLEAQKEIDRAIAEEETGRLKRIRNSIIFALLITILFGGLLYLSYRRKKKDNRLLNAQKLKIEQISKQVHESDQAKLKFFTNVSHELRTPLTLIMGLTENQNKTPDINNTLALIRKNSHRLLHMINQLLDLKKLDESKMSLQVSRGNLSVFVRGTAASFENLAHGKGITLGFRQDGEDITGVFDHDKVEKILTNLLLNAIKYNHDNGEITVRISADPEGFAIVSICDTGPGIAPSELKNIFTRFYRLSDTAAQGSGLGLALVRELVILHKGTITADSKVGVGSCFTTRIPIQESCYKPGEFNTDDNLPYPNLLGEVPFIDTEDSEIVHVIHSDPDEKTILIVEDNSDLRRFISDLFVHSYQIVEAADGEEGCEMSLKHVPDIIICDIMMPKLSGTELVSRIKSNPVTSHIPVIILTAMDDKETIVSSFVKGADEFISKPFESEILISRVENLLRIRKQLIEKFTSQFHLQPRNITIDDVDQKFLQKTIDTIEKYLSDPDLNINRLAAELSVSRTQLYRKLKALTDYSANQFIRLIRLKRAADMLSQGKHNISEIMDATGFNNYSHFNSCFKELYGSYPKEYKKSV
ncbi:MAG: ATP-binding protein [Bacteroidales bacterium]